MEIEAVPRKAELTLRVAGVGELELTLSGDALGTYRAMAESQRRLDAEAEELRRRCSTEDKVEAGTAMLQYMVRTGDIQLEAIRTALDADAWAKLEAIADRLPVPTISRIHAAIAQLAVEALVSDLKEGRS